MRGSGLWGNHHHNNPQRSQFHWLWMIVVALVGIAGLCVRLAHAQDAECAEVKIVIEQKLSLERQAFDARMVIRNGLDTSALSNVKVELLFKDRDRRDVVATSDPVATGATFFVRVDSLQGLSALDGSAHLSAKSAADIRWLLIPAQGAGGSTSEGKLYYIGARVTYTLNGETTTVEVTPDYVVVRPQPLLRLDYFLPTDVYADDPFTPEVEVAEPFTLGVRVLNKGAGPAPKTQIESAQPKIVENRQGLLIDFTILGAFVGNAPAGKSLLLDFGDIGPVSAKVGRWMMQTSLAGRFTDFNASFVHADSLGGAVTSLVEDIVTHKLVHDVRIELAGHDDIDDFLAEQGDGYRVYDSQGGDAPVFNLSGSATLSLLPAGNMSLQFPPTQGLVHVKLPDPGRGGRKLAQVLRSDGKQLAPQNFWLSRARNGDLSWSYYVHVFDQDSTGQYSLIFTNGTNASLDGSAYRDVNGNGVRDADEPAEGNLAVTLKGVDELGRNVTVQAFTDPQGLFAFQGLAPGRYQIEAASRDGWIDGNWIAGNAGGKAVPGLVSDILLLAGTQATGYVISKRKTSVSDGDKADLSIALKTTVSELKPDQSTAVTLTVRNAGPDAATGVTVQSAVPAGLTLQSVAASLGSFAQGVWAIGDLGSGQSATLTLQVRAEALADGVNDRVITWSANAGAQTPDPVSDNNQAHVGLVVRKDVQEGAELTHTLLSRARVLLWASCTGGAASSTDLQACARGKAESARTWLAARADKVHASTDLRDWRVALRSGSYNMLWFVGGTQGLDATALAEVQAAVRRGDSLVVEGASGPLTAGWKVMLGAAPADSSAAGNTSVALQGAAAQPIRGPAYGLQVTSALPMASYPDTGELAIAGHTHGHGQTLLVGFELLGMASDPGYAAWSGYAEQQLRALTPVVRVQPALAGSSFGLRLTARSLAAQATTAEAMGLELGLPAAWKYQDAAPPALGSSSASQPKWDLALAGGQEQSVDLTLVAPSTSGAEDMAASLRAKSSQGELARTVLGVQVLGLDTLVPRIEQTLASLNSADSDVQAAIARCRASATQVLQAQKAGQWGLVLDELATLLANLEALAALPGAPAIADLQLDVARWFFLAQIQWAPEVAPTLPQISAESGGGQSAFVGQPFGSVLSALVRDASGQALAGKSVRFELPGTGASANFAGGVRSANALTDAQGIAHSPVLTANTTAGAYEARASVAGAAVDAVFALENKAQSAPLLTLLAVEGNGQTARAGTLYAKPLSVRVVDSQSRPQAGLSVRFEIPAGGAAAQFENSGKSSTAAVVSTDANGVAVSPPLRANAIAGNFQVRASLVTIEVPPIFFDLTNQAAPVSAPQFSGTTATGSGNFTATVSGGGAGCGFNPSRTQLLPPTGMNATLGRILLPHGVFDFELVGCTPGGEVTITTTWPDLRGITGYLKYGVTPLSRGKKVWYPPAGLHISGNTVRYTIRDGGWGDDDLTVNGVIRDPGGPVVEAADTAVAIPALDLRTAVLLGLMLVMVGGMALRRRTGGR